MKKLLRKVQGVQYELFDMCALDEMAPMVAEAFNRYEPMAVAQSRSLSRVRGFR